MFIDSHAHLELFEDLDEVLGRAKEAGVSKIITIGTTLETSSRAIHIAENISTRELEIYATCGIHPNDGAEEVNNLGLGKVMKSLREIANSSKKVVGIGECGLDYFLDASSQRPETCDKEKDFQRKLFGEQIKIAAGLGLPLIVHCRNAWDEIFDLIPKSAHYVKTSRGKQTPNSKLSGVFHSWTGDLHAMKRAFDLGFYISFSGIVTFANAANIKEVVKNTPSNRILVETDSPFLSPEPLRGMKNEPKNVRITADFISSLRGSSLSEISDITTRSACEVFGI